MLEAGRECTRSPGDIVSSTVPKTWSIIQTWPTCQVMRREPFALTRCLVEPPCKPVCHTTWKVPYSAGIFAPIPTWKFANLLVSGSIVEWNREWTSKVQWEFTLVGGLKWSGTTVWPLNVNLSSEQRSLYLSQCWMTSGQFPLSLTSFRYMTWDRIS